MDSFDSILTDQTACELKLTDGVYDYYVIPSSTTADPASRTIQFSTPQEVEELIETSIRCTGDTHDLQRFMDKHHHGSAWDASNKKLTKKVAALLVNRKVEIKLRAESTPGGGTFAQESPIQNHPRSYSIASALPSSGSSALKYKIIEDQPNEFIPGVLLTVTLPDGSFKELPSAYDGRISIENIQQGVSGINLDISASFGATLENTFDYICVKSKPTEAEPEPPNNADRVHQRTEPKDRQERRYIAQIVEHQVTKGQTLASIAQDNNTTFRDLAFFNWGTYEKKQVLKLMERDIGCKTKTANGRDFRFTGEESPGVIYVPTPLTISDLKTDMEHTIRVRRTGYDLSFLYKVAIDDPDIKDDTITLISDDNTWEYTLCIKELEEVEEDWILMVFPAPPKGKIYSLIHTPGKSNVSSYILRSTAYDSIQFDEKVSLDGGLLG